MFETIDITTFETACDGGKGALGHPRVYLHIDPATGDITCPYCSRTYRYVTLDHAPAAHTPHAV